MRHMILIAVMLASLFCFAQLSDELAPPPAAPATPIPTAACLAVKPIGSHAFRNVFFFGLAGAIVSKEQYQVLGVENYPAKVGQKFHGSDLQTIQAGGTKIVILDKHYTPEDLANACK